VRGLLGAVAQLLAALVVLVVLLAAIELAAGFFVERAKAPGERTLMRTDKPDFVGDALTVLDLAPEINPTPLVGDPVLLWRNKAGASKTQPVNPEHWGHPETWTVDIDARGYREATEDPPADDVYRVLLVGDSITFGFNVDQGKAFDRGLMTRLAERYPGRRVDVINAAVPGWSWLQGLRFLETEGLALEPDLVVIGHGTNDRFFPATSTDIERMPPPSGPRRWFAELMRVLWRTNTFRALLRRSTPKAGDATESPGCRRQIERDGNCRRLAIEEIERAVREIAALTAAHGADLILLNVDFIQTDAVAGSRAAAQAGQLRLLDFVQRVTALREREETARARSLGLAPADHEPAGDGTRRVVLRVHAPGVEPPISAVGNAPFTTFTFDTQLYDDGTGGDERAGDEVYSGTVEVPEAVSRFEYQCFQRGAPEFRPLPPLPSNQGLRVQPVRGNERGPVVRFGELYLMAEGTHPDAAGHAVIADGLATEIEGLPSFQRFVETGRT
jgi:lysophospholipase L1-like esterase